MPDEFPLPLESCILTPGNDDMDESKDHEDHVVGPSCCIFDRIFAEGLEERNDFQPDSKVNLGQFLQNYMGPSYMYIDSEVLPALSEFVIEEGASLLGLGLDRDLENAMSSSSRAGK